MVSMFDQSRSLVESLPGHVTGELPAAHTLRVLWKGTGLTSKVKGNGKRGLDSAFPVSEPKHNSLPLYAIG